MISKVKTQKANVKCFIHYFIYCFSLNENNVPFFMSWKYIRRFRRFTYICAVKSTGTRHLLFHTMACFYVIYRYVISQWRSIKPVENNQYDITMTTHDIKICNDIAWDAHCEITVGNDVARDIDCDVTMGNDVAMCTYHGITMHNDFAMNLFYYVFSSLCLIMVLLWVSME